MPEIHSTSITLSRPLPPEVEAGAELSLGVQVTCPFGCDLRGENVQLLAPDGSVVTAELVSHEDGVNEAEILSLKAPVETGEHTWTVLFPSSEVGGVVHEGGSVPVGSTIQPHETSVAVWDLPAPVVIGERFTAKMGIKCSAECRLTGQLVEIRDEAGIKVGEGSLGDAPWPGTQALYWAEVRFEAPPKEGSFTWSVGSVATELESSHREASAVLSFSTVGPPEHTVRVEVVRDDTEAPIDKVAVRLGIYRASTDERGLAKFELPSGEFELTACKPGFEADPATVKVMGDLEVRIVARYVPPTNPDDEQIWM